ncbi:NUDIX hydrolase [Herpetosiphon llansteffanensis]|uniref:NUDIX hydrolase n=1 Tax=Herpetosiphon llansteffanensis TaxID=2094568 RepID=UPI000D7CFC5E|nr:NUDIX domain-containing protein [Herpetosiphon llansteffanensis]
MRSTIRGLVNQIAPLDLREQADCNKTLTWIDSDAPLFRTAKPATPPMHLVSYIVVYDPATAQILLVDHRNAQLWLPCGGHVEPDEHPASTVSREIEEELGIEAQFYWPEPCFISVTETVGLTAGHIDVSLWYVVQADSQQTLRYDQAEFAQIRWFALDDVPLERSDPQLGRFLGKFQQLLNREDRRLLAVR